MLFVSACFVGVCCLVFGIWCMLFVVVVEWLIVGDCFSPLYEFDFLCVLLFALVFVV